MQLDFFKTETVTPETTKVCNTCNTEKDIKEFYIDQSRSSQAKCDCRDCYTQKVMDRRHIKKTAPPPPDSCQCCGSSFDTSSRVLDHCHIDRVFRGWICARCNTGLGHFGDSIDQLEKGIAYLKRYKDERP